MGKKDGKDHIIQCIKDLHNDGMTTTNPDDIEFPDEREAWDPVFR